MFPTIIHLTQSLNKLFVLNNLEELQSKYQNQTCGNEIAKLEFIQQEYCLNPSWMKEQVIDVKESIAKAQLLGCYASKLFK
ncbi:MAG: hypothetical protein ACD_73C00120G0003 [uncultured bacterium]|nr:MAG: hypothetical protein ACD_73C00120G0003 [uncultured bacterium]